MKKLIPLFLLFTCLINAQEYKLEERTITGVFEKTGKTKSELFSSINRWISINYNSSINVIQMNNIDSGTIIVKGINEVKYKDNLTKILSPKSNIEYATMKVSHLIEINIKDGRYRVIYKVVDLAIQDSGYNDLVINCINFNKVDDESIQNYNSILKKNLKGAFSNEKTELYLTNIKPMFEEISTNLADNIKLTMVSIYNSIETSTSNDW